MYVEWYMYVPTISIYLDKIVYTLTYNDYLRRYLFVQR